MKTGTAATFSSHLFRISSSEKLSPSASVIMTTTTLATCFEGLIPHELFSWLDTNSKGKHYSKGKLTPSGFRFAAPAVDIASHTRFKAASLFTMFTVKKLQYIKIVLLCTKISSVEMYKKCSEVL
jgi:hypothetical protein